MCCESLPVVSSVLLETSRKSEGGEPGSEGAAGCHGSTGQLPSLPTRSFSLFPLLSVCYICFPTEEGLPRGDPRVWDWCSALCPLLSQNAGWVSPSSDGKQFVRANECGRQRHGKEDVMHMFTRVKSDCITYYWSLFHIKASRHYNTEG